MEVINISELGKRAKNGDDKAMLEIINFKKWMIKKYSYSDEDCYQTIILKLIKGIKGYKFK